jgi:comEA protein
LAGEEQSRATGAEAGEVVSPLRLAAAVTCTRVAAIPLRSRNAAAVRERKQGGPTSHFGRSGAAADSSFIFLEDSMRRLTFVIAIIMAASLAAAPLAVAQAAKPAAAKPGGSKGGSAAKAKATPASPVNLNAASITQLQTLPGVGASTAQRILDYRQKNGGFKKIEELMNVQGVGEKSFLKLKPLITVNADRSAAAEGQK